MSFTKLPESTDWGFWSNGYGGASRIVGYADGVNRVVRYKITTRDYVANRDVGASKFSFVRTGSTEYGGTPTSQGEKLRFFIGTDPNSHLNAGVNSEYHGEATAVRQSDGTYTITSETINIVLLPNTTYYLFIFPGFASYGAYTWEVPVSQVSLTFDGGAGVVRIKEADQELITVPMVKKDGELVQLSAMTKSGDDLIFCV